MLRCGLALLIWFGVVTQSFAQYSQLVVFGDSLSDVGNLSRATFGLQPGGDYYEGRFSNGPVYSELLASKLSLAALRPSRDGGLNYAHGGARTSGTSFLEGGLFIDDLDDQIDDFFDDRQPNASDLYVVFIGSNDFILGEADNPAGRANRAFQQIDRLLAAGVKNLLSINLPMLGESPDGRQNRDVLNERAREFNAVLKAGLDAVAIDGGSLFQLDLAEVFSIVLEEPQAFGFTNMTQQGISASNASGFLFWDGNHPTTQAHALFAEAAFRAVSPDAMIPGDFNLDRVISPVDVDLLGQQIRRQTSRLSFDLNSDESLTLADLDWLLDESDRINADLDFDREVGFSDFLVLSGNFGRTDETLRWSDGDLDVNGQVEFLDFLTLSGNFGEAPALRAVPEPKHSAWLLLGLAVRRFGRRRRCLE